MKKIIVTMILLLNITYGVEALHLYGGDNHKKYLGCINCSEFDSNSICNEFGSYGSEFNSDSIWNEFSTFGSEFSSSSPWNEFSSSAPVIVDKSGNFYGYFTINEFHRKRTNIGLYVYFLNNYKKFEKLEDARNWLCKQH